MQLIIYAVADSVLFKNELFDYRFSAILKTLVKVVKIPETKIQQRRIIMAATREEHLLWCKKRALEYVDAGDVKNAWQSMVSDLGMHDETKGHIAIGLGTMLMMAQKFNTPDEMRKFIEGFN
jgi:hypothetical protein